MRLHVVFWRSEVQRDGVVEDVQLWSKLPEQKERERRIAKPSLLSLCWRCLIVEVAMKFIGVELAFHHTERPAIDKSTYPTRVGHPRPRRPVPRSTAAVSIQMN
jgi:hypothetical protein